VVAASPLAGSGITTTAWSPRLDPSASGQAVTGDNRRVGVDTECGVGYRILAPERWRTAVNLEGWNLRTKSAATMIAVAAMLGGVGAGCDKMRGDGSDKKAGTGSADGTGGGTGAGTGTGTGASPGTGSAAPTGAILIGEYGSMTGAEATFGQSTHNGIMLAVEERNAAGGVKGRKIAVKNYDDAGKTQEAGNAVTRLITQDNVVAILGEVASSLSLAGGAVAQEKGVPMISPSSTNEEVTELGDMISRVCFVDGFQGYVAAKFARENLKAAKVAILTDKSSAYSVGLANEFQKAFTGMGGKIVTQQTYNKGDVDYGAQLTSIRGESPDAVFLPGYYTDVGNIAIQARKLGIKAPFLGGDGWDSPQLAAIGGKAIEGSYYSNHYSHEEQRPEVQEFVAKYQKKYGAVPDGLAALGYDAARVLFDAMERAPSLDGKPLAAAIAETKDFPGVTGKITIDENRNAKKAAVVLQMKDGKPTFAASIPAQE
jgi:branched-chain amino acid transport system substrate-binding protein